MRIPKGLKDFVAGLGTVFNHTLVHGFNPCSYAFVGDQDEYQFQAEDLLENDNRTIENVPIVIDWVIGNQTCEQAGQSADYACRENSHCVQDPETDLGGYRCHCNEGYEGNSYLSPGCTG